MSRVGAIPFSVPGSPEVSETIASAVVEYSVHTLHPIIARHCKNIFPDVVSKASEARQRGRDWRGLDALLAVPTFQQCDCDMLEFTETAEAEKDRCLRSFYAWSGAVCAVLTAAGHWADFIDPCSGYPVLGKRGSTLYNEVEGTQLLLQYRHQQVGTACGTCKVILHPKWGQRIYPATLFTTAPADAVVSAVASVEAKYPVDGKSGGSQGGTEAAKDAEKKSENGDDVNGGQKGETVQDKKGSEGKKLAKESKVDAKKNGDAKSTVGSSS